MILSILYICIKNKLLEVEEISIELVSIVVSLMTSDLSESIIKKGRYKF